MICLWWKPIPPLLKKLARHYEASITCILPDQEDLSKKTLLNNIGFFIELVILICQTKSRFNLTRSEDEIKIPATVFVSNRM